MSASVRTGSQGLGLAEVPPPLREGPRPPPPAPLPPAAPRGPEPLVLGELSRVPRRRRAGATAISFGAHLVVVAAIVLIPVLMPVALPVQARDPVMVLIFDPPPPPPLPLPRGDPLLPKTGRAPARRAEPTPAPLAPTPTPVPTLLPRAVVPPDLTPPSLDAAPAGGSDTGSDAGVPEGMEGGVPEGQVGGVPGGVVGGVVGGRLGGLVPVRDYDQGPRLLRSVKPTYPQDAFVKKIEGTVLLEILIDDHGRVVRARVLQSVPLLDAAAIAAVKQWLFQPAVRRGRPVPTVANAPISFRIY